MPENAVLCVWAGGPRDQRRLGCWRWTGSVKGRWKGFPAQWTAQATFESDEAMGAGSPGFELTEGTLQRDLSHSDSVCNYEGHEPHALEPEDVHLGILAGPDYRAVVGGGQGGSVNLQPDLHRSRRQLDPDRDPAPL